MSLSIGIVGLPNVGKSTLFSALTNIQADAENYPFCTIDPNVGVVEVKDERVDMLAKIFNPKRVVYATLEFVDIAGLVRGASKGEGLGNQFLSNIRGTDAILHVVRIFEDENIAHVDKKIDPVSDIQTINSELILSDIALIERRIEKLQREIKSQKKEALFQYELLNKIKDLLLKEQFLTDVEFSEKEEEFLKTLQLITKKPVLYLLNKKMGAKNLDELNDERYQRLQDFLKDKKFLIIDAKMELELNELDPKEREEYKSSLGLSEESGLVKLAKVGYETLGLISFLTAGEKEVRAWTIKKGTNAQDAASVIHTDFGKNFVKAEVIKYEDLIKSGSYSNARDAGLIMIKGRDYVVKDGDVIEFKVAA